MKSSRHIGKVKQDILISQAVNEFDRNCMEQFSVLTFSRTANGEAAECNKETAMALVGRHPGTQQRNVVRHTIDRQCDTGNVA